MQVTLFRQRVHLARPVRASGERHHERSRLFLRIHHDAVEGFGEIAPQPSDLNGDAGYDAVVVAIGNALRRVQDVLAREGALPHWARVARLSSGSSADQSAYALIEMALLDRELRERRESSSSLWPRAFSTPRQQTVSLLDDEAWSVSPGVARVRVKIAPGPLAASGRARLRELSVPVLLDYNCSATSDDEVVAHVKDIGDVAEVVAVEQPYAAGNVIDHARLATRLPVPVSIDEGLRSARDLRHVANYAAARMVCVKPARVGGLANARTLVALAGELGLSAYLGGFFESPYGRGVHRRFAEAWVSEASDLDDVSIEEPGPESASDPYAFGVVPAPAMLERADVLSVVL